MDDYASDYPIIVLKVDVHNCQKCWNKVKRKFKKIDGVISVAIEPEQKLVSVRGKVDVMLLIKAIQRGGKHAELLYYQKHPPKTTQTSAQNQKNYDHKQQQQQQHKGMHKNCCSEDGYGHRPENHVHQCEDYVPPKDPDEHICKNPHCEFHRRGNQENVSYLGQRGNMFWPNEREYFQGEYPPFQGIGRGSYMMGRPYGFHSGGGSMPGYYYG